MSTRAKPNVWMPLYFGDYLADTMHLTTEQHGAYLLLLMAAWKADGFLPDDDRQLAAIARLDQRTWIRYRPVLCKFFIIDDRGWSQKRLLTELSIAKHLIETNRNNGQKGGRPKANEEAKGKRTETQTIAEAEPTGLVSLDPDHNRNHNRTGWRNETPSPTPLSELRSAPPDYVQSVWDLGVALLGEQGVREASARAFLGSLLKEWDEQTVEEALRAAVGKAQAQGYIRAFLKAKPKKGESEKLRLAI